MGKAMSPQELDAEPIGAQQPLLQRAALALIVVYQRYISPMTPPSCRFSPSCSSYASQAIQLYGWWRGGWLAFHRIARCHPLHPGGSDPVPQEHASETQDPKNWRDAPSSNQKQLG